MLTTNDEQPNFCGAKGIRTPGLFHAMEALYQLSYSPKTISLRYPNIQLTDEAPADERYVAIEALDLIKSARVVVENVHDNAAIVDKYPLLLRHTFT